jgi:hypothetical protein
LWALLKENGAVWVNTDLFTKCFEGQEHPESSVIEQL